MEGLCVLCKEPITNPVSIEVIGRHIGTWMPKKIRKNFKNMNSVLSNHVKEFCITGLEHEQMICIHCYVGEVFQWLKRVDYKLSDKFLSIFSFGYSKQSFQLERTRTIEKMSDEDENEFGICDECGEYSDKLANVAGEWMCESCCNGG